MCPFCIGTALWIAAGAITTGGVSALTITKLHNKKREEGESHDGQSADPTAAAQ